MSSALNPVLDRVLRSMATSKRDVQRIEGICVDTLIDPDEIVHALLVLVRDGNVELLDSEPGNPRLRFHHWRHGQKAG